MRLSATRCSTRDPKISTQASPVAGFELMHSRVCWGLYPIGNWLEARYHRQTGRAPSPAVAILRLDSGYRVRPWPSFSTDILSKRKHPHR
jgi:hypothetical protein